MLKSRGYSGPRSSPSPIAPVVSMPKAMNTDDAEPTVISTEKMNVTRTSWSASPVRQTSFAVALQPVQSKAAPLLVSDQDVGSTW